MSRRKSIPLPPSLTQPVPPDLPATEPVLFINEHQLLATLSLPASSDNIDELIVAGALTLIDGYDRKMTREAYGDLITTMLNFLNRMVRQAVSNGLIRAYDVGIGCSTTELKAFSAEHFKAAEELRKQLVSTLKLLMECRQPGTPIQ